MMEDETTQKDFKYATLTELIDSIEFSVKIV